MGGSSNSDIRDCKHTSVIFLRCFYCTVFLLILLHFLNYSFMGQIKYWYFEWFGQIKSIVLNLIDHLLSATKWLHPLQVKTYWWSGVLVSVIKPWLVLLTSRSEEVSHTKTSLEDFFLQIKDRAIPDKYLFSISQFIVYIRLHTKFYTNLSLIKE
jgi:hypothetical protein